RWSHVQALWHSYHRGRHGVVQRVRRLAQHAGVIRSQEQEVLEQYADPLRRRSCTKHGCNQGGQALYGLQRSEQGGDCRDQVTSSEGSHFTGDAVVQSTIFWQTPVILAMVVQGVFTRAISCARAWPSTTVRVYTVGWADSSRTGEESL